jgi:hypothetical protein
MNRDSSVEIGRWASLAIAIETVVFSVALVWEVAVPSELAKNLGYVASLLIAVSVVVMMSSFYDQTRGHLRIFAFLALVSSILYAPLCIGTYFLQLSVVARNPLGLTREVMELINFKPGSAAFALDMLGYGFLCLSTLAAGFALVEARDKMLRALCFFHGALVIPTIASPIMSGLFLSTTGETDNTGNYVLIFWCVVFVPIALLFRRHFRVEQGRSIRT